MDVRINEHERRCCAMEDVPRQPLEQCLAAKGRTERPKKGRRKWLEQERTKYDTIQNFTTGEESNADTTNTVQRGINPLEPEVISGNRRTSGDELK